MQFNQLVNWTEYFLGHYVISSRKTEEKMRGQHKDGSQRDYENRMCTEFIQDRVLLLTFVPVEYSLIEVLAQIAYPALNVNEFYNYSGGQTITSIYTYERNATVD
jgi:hypothetical protein